jgi:hypothetical protein
MKKLVTSLLVAVTFSAFAQKTDADYFPTYYKCSTCRSSFTKVKLEGTMSNKAVQQYLKQTLSNLKDYRTGLKFNYKNESPGGFHYSFTQTFNGVAVYQSEIKLNTDKQNTIRSIFDNSENTAAWNLNTASATVSSVIALRNDVPVLCQREIINGHTEVLTGNGEIIFARDTRSYVNKDSVVSGKAFNPDPLTSNQQNYGAPYDDNEDNTNAQLDAQREPVTFTATFTGSQFLLENAFLRVRDFDGPTAAPATSAVPQFYFNREQSGFEDVNAFYHISQIQQHIHSLGFGCADSLVDIDTHAVGGADNSYFSAATNPQRIYFGEGGVDDAEDADVCVHEYGHFIAETAAPGSNDGSYRNALDEGFGDYLAGSYSRSISTYRDNQVFNWDGHNEFWIGRVLDATWKYPEDLTGSIYRNGQIWSAVLWCLNGSIGRAATDSLILQTHYAYAADISFPDAAALLMDADTLLTGGKYACPIYQCLFNHGLHPSNPFINCGVGVSEPENFPVQFLNQNNSFTVTNPASSAIELQVLNTTGQLIWNGTPSQPVFTYTNSSLASGVYLVNIKANGVVKTFKWSKTSS